MTQTITLTKTNPDFRKAVGISLKVCAAVAAVCALLLTFTVGDYYIFNRISQYGFFFCISQWFKKAGLLLILAAVFFNCKSCADAVKYVLPLFIILSCCLFGDFFDIVTPVPDDKPAQEIFNKINLGFPKWLNVTLFFLQNVALTACCALFFVRDGYKIAGKSFISLPFALLLTMPLNIFENFFDINKIPADSFLRFKNFTLWHFLALCVLVGSTLGLYYFLKNKPREQQDKYLAVVAISLLLQYHSKDSMVMGDGYNVYYTVFACLPLFICNIGVYVSSISVILKKRVLYAISFFIHAVGALTVFVYFGKDSMSDYGIFASHSILYFCLTHWFLFALCVL
ncbi:MAG: YwaF family protein, partial [Clostridia bacterium]|nr:YwaF family protein [Clostridia bacterium]